MYNVQSYKRFINKAITRGDRAKCPPFFRFSVYNYPLMSDNLLKCPPCLES